MSPSCVVPVSKVRDYLLDPDHKDGGPKSKFLTSHGFSRARHQDLSDALEAHFLHNDVAARIETPLGTKLVIYGRLATPDGRTLMIKSIWIEEKPGSVPSFVTAVPR